jgi:hypothetical protein
MEFIIKKNLDLVDIFFLLFNYSFTFHRILMYVSANSLRVALEYPRVAHKIILKLQNKSRGLAQAKQGRAQPYTIRERTS